MFCIAGCRITVEEGSFSSAYVSSEVAVNHLLLNVHSCLEEKRKQAEKDEGRGPCVLFCGPADVGKSSAMKVRWYRRLARESTGSLGSGSILFLLKGYHALMRDISKERLHL